MAYQETKTTGYGTRLSNSLGGMLTGIVLFFGATALLWWNEGRAVKTADMLSDAQEACVEMPNPDKRNAELEGSLVCGTAMATTNDVLTDKNYGVSETAIGLQRHVEYFQWVEHSEEKSEDKFGGKEVTTTTYTYTKEWVDSPEKSEEFKDPAYQGKNHTWTQVEDEEQWAKNVSFGAYKLNESLIECIRSKEAVDLKIDNAQLKSLNKMVGDSYAAVFGRQAVQNQAPAQQNAGPAQTQAQVADSAQAAIPDSVKTVVPDSINQQNKVDYEFVHQMGNVLYLGRNANVPEIGDVRITFDKIVPAKVTIIAQVDGDTFKAFKASNKKRYQTLVMGKKSMDEIFEDEESANSTMTWILRFLGVFLVFCGLRSLFGLLETLLKVIPFLSNIVAFGVSIICGLVAVVYSLIVIAIAWIFYRPVLGIILLCIAGFLVWVFAFNGKKKLGELADKAKEEMAKRQAQKAGVPAGTPTNTPTNTPDQV